jgi:hypothetical protein
VTPSAPLHPNLLCEALLEATTHPEKRRNLQLLHKVCRERHALGSSDFSLKSIAVALADRGGPKGKTLWNPSSADYRTLVEAWRVHSAPNEQRQRNGSAALSSQRGDETQDSLLRHISDPATRILLAQRLKELDALRAQVNILKSQSNLTIDKRQRIHEKSTTEVTPDGVTVEIQTGPTLNALEREALEHAISQELWRDEGWHAEKLGRVVKSVGNEGNSRTIFKAGFVTAVRKILGKK